MKNLLIVEDDRTLSKGLCLALGSVQCTVEPQFSLADARQAVRTRPYDLILLDINLPDGSGLEFLQEIRRTFQIPVILLTANDTEMEIVTGLELGAEDYIVKPFSLAVLRARVKAQLRRGTVPPNHTIHIGKFSFDFDSMSFRKDGQAVELSKTEQRLLRCLVENRNITLTRDRLIDLLWTDGAAYVDENALSVTIKRLRDKLEDNPSHPDYIKTVYGLGYTFVVN